jgi:anhydro-N-acetylmuramic acid kinase
MKTNLHKTAHSRTMIVAGVMSGTSADGINVALVRMGVKGYPREGNFGFELLGHSEQGYPKQVREAILAAMNATQVSVANLARLNFLLGELYADAVLRAQKKFGVKVDLIGCHGQTIYHQGEAAKYLGYRVAPTWQTGEGAVIAARTAAPVVADFRPADMAAGGKGAPLVPFLDYALFRHPKIFRIAQNIGGIANLSAIPAGAAAEQVIAFDSGPGNMVIDAVTEKLLGLGYDKDGKIAATGKAHDGVVQKLLRGKFFRARPPKTAGREEFGREFVQAFLASCGRIPKQDIVATATALTAHSIATAIGRFVLPPVSPQRKILPPREMILAGGGAKNRTLVAMLARELDRVNVRLRFSDEFGLPSTAKEAVAFAVLAYETWHRRPSNLPSATGAKRPAVLGKISYP